MCLPIASTVADVIQSADQQCIVGLLAKMGKVLFWDYVCIMSIVQASISTSCLSLSSC